MNDVAGVIEDVEEVAIPVPHIQTQMVERTADVPQTSTVQQPVAYAASHHASCRVTISSTSVADNGRSNDSGGIQANSSASDELQPQIVESPIPVCQETTQDFVREVD